jgi:hypothetical protein
METKEMKTKLTFLLSLTFLVCVFSVVAEAHRSGCHRWHSCPSDSGSYICGDTGRCSACPNNQFCENGKPIARSAKPNTSNKSYESHINGDILNNFTSNKSTKHSEADYVDYVCPKIKGMIEYSLDDGSRVDCETETHSIEFDFAKKWAESIGQALYYSSKTGKKAGIFLIIASSNDWKHLEKVNKVIKEKKMDIKVWTVMPKDLNN